MCRVSLQKPRPKLLDRQDVARENKATDRTENAKVKKRSGGRCEVALPMFIFHDTNVATLTLTRCERRAAHVHHLISGIGRRNRGVSILAEHKLHVCAKCHREIHGHVLNPQNATAEREAASTVTYERVR